MKSLRKSHQKLPEKKKEGKEGLEVHRASEPECFQNHKVGPGAAQRWIDRSEGHRVRPMRPKHFFAHCDCIKNEKKKEKKLKKPVGSLSNSGSHEDVVERIGSEELLKIFY